MKIIKVLWVLVCILSIAIVCGCATQPKFNVNGQTFYSSEGALNYIKMQDKEFTDKIIPTKTPVGGKARYIVPSESLMRKTGDVIREKAGKQDMDEVYKKFFTDIAIEKLKVDYERLKNRKIFDDIVFTTSDDPQKDALAVKDMTVIYKTVNSDGKYENFVRKQGAEPVLIKPNSALNNKPLEFYDDFFGQIEKVAR